MKVTGNLMNNMDLVFFIKLTGKNMMVAGKTENDMEKQLLHYLMEL